MTEFTSNTLTVSEEMFLDFAPETIWPQLCPTREYDWIEVWDCELVHSESGYNELGCVFRTDFPTEGEKETWVTSRFDPFERIEFVRTNSNRVIRFVIELEADGPTTTVRWTQHVTPLNKHGIEYVKDKPEAFAAQIEALGKMLSHYLETGTMLKGEELGLIERIKAHVHGRKTG